MKNIDLGKIAVPLDDYASQGNAILGIRDSGKSYTATAIAERLMDAGIPIIAFDPIGIWRYLRVPGSGKGYEVVVAGGKTGDLPLTPRGAQEIVRAAMRENVSLVVDLYDINLSKADWREVVGSCIRTLLYENGDHGLRHIFIEEAAEFCPQIVGPDQGRVYAEVEKLARMGGNALLGYTLINQRAEQVNKAVLELCDCLILHRQKGRNSINALSKWLDLAAATRGNDIARSLPMLAQGECWVWPAGIDTPVRTKIPGKHSFHPDRRARQAAPKAGGIGVDVSGFVSTMRTSLEALTKEAEANDPKRLRARVAELERDRGHPQMDRAALVEARTEGARQGYAAALSAVQPFATRLGTLAAGISETIEGFQADLRRLLASAPETLAVQRIVRRAEAPQVDWHDFKNVDGTGRLIKHPVQIDASRSSDHSGSQVDKAMPRAILTALAQHPNGLSKGQVLVHTDYRSSGPVSTCFAELTRNQWIGTDGSGRRLMITRQGLDALGPYDPLPTGTRLREYLLNGSKLAPMEKKMLRAIFDDYPGAIGKGRILERTGYASSGPTSKAFARLVALGYAMKDGRGALRASDDLFSEAAA